MMKFLVLGNKSVGKSSLLHRLTHGIFPETTGSSINLFQKSFAIPNQEEIHANFFELGGLYSDDLITKSALDGTTCAIFCYDLTNILSLKHVLNWIEKYEENSQEHSLDLSPYCIIGCKSDLEKKIDDSQIYEIINETNAIFSDKTSAKSGANVDTAFQTIVQYIYNM